MKFRELHFEFVLGVLPFFCIVSIVGAQQPDPNSPRYKGVVKLVKYIDSEGDKPLKAFLKEQIVDSLKKSMAKRNCWNY